MVPNHRGPPLLLLPRLALGRLKDRQENEEGFGVLQWATLTSPLHSVAVSLRSNGKEVPLCRADVRVKLSDTPLTVFMGDQGKGKLWNVVSAGHRL